MCLVCSWKDEIFGVFGLFVMMAVFSGSWVLLMGMIRRGLVTDPMLTPRYPDQSEGPLLGPEEWEGESLVGPNEWQKLV